MNRSLPTDAATIRRFLHVLEHDVLPLTEEGVSTGNKIFGAAILAKSDLSVVTVATNRETHNPLWHGEVCVINRYYESAEAGRPKAADCLFLSTHEPCSLCLSAIAWSGFDNFYYLFDYTQSRDVFDIPHDLDILREVFGLDAGAYNRSNAYWTGVSIPELVAACSPDDRGALVPRVDELARRYRLLSERYQRGKSRGNIPLR